MDGTPFGRYQLIELLGRGGMGEVWRAYDPTMGRTVALKVLPPNFADDRVFQERFRREARAAAGLDEPHVVPVYDFGEINRRLYVTMRLIKGRDLEDLLEDGPLEPARAVGVVEQIAYALDAAHQIGLVHRDVKPSNILVGEHDFAYLIDFGIARAAGETGLTSTGATIGTWAYMAPERLNTGQADARADIYALACVLHEAMTGQRPFPGDSLEQQIVGHLTKPPPRPSALRTGVPEAFDEVIATGMAKDPAERYGATKDLAQAARAALAVPVRQLDVHTPTQSTEHVVPEQHTEPTPKVSRADAPTHLAFTTSLPDTAAPTKDSRRGLTTVPPVSRARRAVARLIDIIPILVVFGIAYGIAAKTTGPRCSSWEYPEGVVRWTWCKQDVSGIGATGIVVAGLTALAYGVWNLIRRRRKGASIGQSVLKFKVVDPATGQPSKLPRQRVAAAVIALLLLIGLGAAAAGQTAHRIANDKWEETCLLLKATADTYYKSRCTP
ncbi:MAG: protein kinase [Mycobacterium sp.]|uniref:protein kinase domain-containing protein n=1 Tax=Mycobacterium sp. TaxID=1785 RepID=UPI001EC84CEC|nr:protein kinase [Mycobacterium sp.]MBW0019556.1 protein kinase [Mycobacterium sp.]